MSARETHVTHVTEFGLGLCAGLAPTEGWYANMPARNGAKSGS